MALKPENPVVGGTVLRRQAIQSPNFVTGVSGWAINQDGSAEFNNVVIRGGTVISGTALYYSGPPALGNLVASISAAAGTDAQGNAYLAGITAYTKIGATFVAAAHSAGQIQWFTAAAAGGPYVASQQIGLNLVSGNLVFSQGPVEFASTLIADAGAVASIGGAAETTHLFSALGYANGWADGGREAASYRATAIPGEIEIWGSLTIPAGGPVAGQTIVTIPAAYRPAQTQSVLGTDITAGNILQRFSIGAGGLFLYQGPAAGAAAGNVIDFSGNYKLT